MPLFGLITLVLGCDSHLRWTGQAGGAAVFRARGCSETQVLGARPPRIRACRPPAQDPGHSPGQWVWAHCLWLSFRARRKGLKCESDGCVSGWSRKESPCFLGVVWVRADHGCLPGEVLAELGAGGCFHDGRGTLLMENVGTTESRARGAVSKAHAGLGVGLQSERPWARVVGFRTVGSPLGAGETRGPPWTASGPGPVPCPKCRRYFFAAAGDRAVDGSGDLGSLALGVGRLWRAPRPSQSRPGWPPPRVPEAD